MIFAKSTFSPGTMFLYDEMPVPASVLRTPDGHAGLKGVYFSGVGLSGAPIEARVDPQVDFNFTDTSPARGLGLFNFSVRWTGTLTPDASGPYQLGFTGDDGYRLWLDGKLVVEDWSTHPASTKTARLN